MLRIDPQSVSNWINRGVLHGRMVGRVMMVDKDTVTKLFDTLEDVANTEKAISELKQELGGIWRKYNDAVSEWQKDIATVCGLERSERLLRLIESMIESVSDDVMTDRERNVMKGYLHGSELEAIGNCYGLTRERIRQIVEKGIRKLGSLETYGDMKKRRDELEEENLLLKSMLKQQDGELKEHRIALNIKREEQEKLKADARAKARLSETDRKIVELLETKLVDMDISVRALNCLKSADLETFGDLVKVNKTDLLKYRNFGRKSLIELDDLLESVSAKVGVRFYFGMNTLPVYESYRQSIIWGDND